MTSTGISVALLRSFIRLDRVVRYFNRMLAIKTEESLKIASEFEEIARTDMAKFLNDFKASLFNIEKDLRYM